MQEPTLTSAPHEPSTMLSASQFRPLWIVTTSLDIDAIISPNLWVDKWRQGEIKPFVHDYKLINTAWAFSLPVNVAINLQNMNTKSSKVKDKLK